jgi:hypothetical protein
MKVEHLLACVEQLFDGLEPLAMHQDCQYLR